MTHILDHPMRNELSHWVMLTDNQWSRFYQIFRRQQAVAGTTIQLPGDSDHDLIFVLDGLLRFYYLDSDGKETNKAFIAENTFAGPLAAAVLNMPIIYGVQALEDTVYLSTPFDHFAALFEADPAFDRIGRKLAEWLLMRKELRTRSLLQQQAKDRYVAFATQHPELIERVPQYHIASYLGISEVSLSRLKRGLQMAAEKS